MSLEFCWLNIPKKQKVVRMIIRKILEENNALTKLLDDYQRVIGNFQGSL